MEPNLLRGYRQWLLHRNSVDKSLIIIMLCILSTNYIIMRIQLYTLVLYLV